MNNDLRSKVQRRVKDAPNKTASDVLKTQAQDTRRTTVYLTSANVRALKRLAADEDTTMSALINEGIEKVLKRAQ